VPFQNSFKLTQFQELNLPPTLLGGYAPRIWTREKIAGNSWG
jgi:hypothetical protein